jgi:hypothetical protein
METTDPRVQDDLGPIQNNQMTENAEPEFSAPHPKLVPGIAQSIALSAMFYAVSCKNSLRSFPALH